MLVGPVVGERDAVAPQLQQFLAQHRANAAQERAEEIDIRPSCEQMLKDIGHPYSEGKPVYDESILRPREEDLGDAGAEDELSDELYDQALAIWRSLPDRGEEGLVAGDIIECIPAALTPSPR